MERLKTDTQETKKKVLGGNTSGNLLNLVFLAERTEAEATKRIAPAPTVVKHVVKKNFGISGGGNVAEKHSILPRKCKK